MNPFDSYMLNKVRRLKDLRTRYAAMGEKTERGRERRECSESCEYNELCIKFT